MYRRFFPQIISSEESLHRMGQGSHAAFSGNIRMLVWNVYKGKHKAWSNDFSNLTHDKDLVLLQESILNTKYDPIFQTPLRYEWVMARTYKSASTLAFTGVKTGAIVPSSTQKFFFSPDAEPIFKTPKMLLTTMYPLAGRADQLLVLNIHAVNFVSLIKYGRQIEQIINAVESHEGPVILAGDFNTWSLQRYKNLMDVTMRMNMKEVALTRAGRWNHMSRHLDHVFYRGLELKSAEVLSNVRTSDHYPISVTFSL